MKLPGLPVDVRDLVKSGSQINEERERPVRVAVFVEIDAPDELIEVVRQELHPHTANASIHVEVAEPDVELLVDSTADVVIGVAGSGHAGLAPQLAAARLRAVPTVVIAQAEDPVLIATALEHPFRDTLAGLDSHELVVDELGEWIVERIPAKRLAFAANFAFMRRAVALESVRNTAWQNGLIGAVTIIPGADMPLMTANQAKMVMQIAAAYGEQLGMERARELLAVVGGGLAFRAVARQFVGLVPGFGWAIKGGIGASGTLAMGYAAIRYFENGADLAGLTRSFEKLRTRIAERQASSGGAQEQIQQHGLPEQASLSDAE